MLNISEQFRGQVVKVWVDNSEPFVGLVRKQDFDGFLSLARRGGGIDLVRLDAILAIRVGK